jgi:hypothetical protein
LDLTITNWTCPKRFLSAQKYWEKFHDLSFYLPKACFEHDQNGLELTQTNWNHPNRFENDLAP